jgi:hypothetical protein
MGVTDDRLDGNAAAGLLQTIFPFEMTTAITVCAGCGARGMIGELAVYAHGMGTVIRCPGCDTALIRIFQGNGHSWLDMRGVVSLRITEPLDEHQRP